MYRTIFSRSIIGLLTLCASLVINPASATEPEQHASPWSLTDLMRSLAQVKSSRAKFVERKHLSMLKTPLSFSGTLEYHAPDQLVKHTLLPKPEKMTLDHDKLVVQSGDASTSRTLSLQEYPSIWAFVESIRSTLAGDVETLNRFYDVSLEGQAKQWQLILHPADSKIKSLVNNILIKGSFDQINTIEIREAGGDYSVMSITRDDS